MARFDALMRLRVRFELAGRAERNLIGGGLRDAYQRVIERRDGLYPEIGRADIDGRDDDRMAALDTCGRLTSVLVRLSDAYAVVIDAQRQIGGGS